MVAAVRRYFGLRLRRATREHDLIWRQGKRSFSVAPYCSFLASRCRISSHDRRWGSANRLLGNGVFLVVAWVGLWYPLDLLFIAREQAKREMRVLGKMLILAGGRTRTQPLPARSGDACVTGESGFAAEPQDPIRRFGGPSKSGL